MAYRSRGLDWRDVSPYGSGSRARCCWTNTSTPGRYGFLSYTSSPIEVDGIRVGGNLHFASAGGARLVPKQYLALNRRTDAVRWEPCYAALKVVPEPAFIAEQCVHYSSTADPMTEMAPSAHTVSPRRWPLSDFGGHPRLTATGSFPLSLASSMRELPR